MRVYRVRENKMDLFFFYRNPLVAVPFDIEFIQQPPEEVRKSIFFNFSIAIRSANGPVNVEKARFEQFLNENVSHIFFCIKVAQDLF